MQRDTKTDFKTLSERIWRHLDNDPDNPETYRDLVSCLMQWQTPESHEQNKKVRRITADCLRTCDADMAQTWWDLYKLSLCYDARSEFDCYLQYIEINQRNEQKFYRNRRRYLLPIVHAYQDILDGKLDLLTVSMPKRAGKSQVEINFVCMMSGMYPDRASLIEGAGDPLVASFYKGCLEYLDEHGPYTFYEMFPDAHVADTNADIHTINLNHKSRFATITARSIEANQVGSTEATNVLCLDDCVAGREEAINRPLLDKKWERLSGDVIGRKLEGTPVVMTGTRYSLYDPIGRMQEWAHDEGKRWKAIEIPALDPKTDESNYEYINPQKNIKMFTTDFFREQRSLLLPEQWESEFQQQPFEAKGILFNKDDLNYFTELPIKEQADTTIAVCDTAESGTDSTALVVAKIYGQDVYITDVVFDNSPAETTKPECARALIRNGVSQALFESNNAGEYYARDVGDLIHKMKGRVGIRTKRTVSNKQTRIECASDNIINYFWFKDPSTYKRDSQYYAFMHEVTTYTRSGKVPHDDAPDALSMLENEIKTISDDQVVVFRRPF